MKEKMQETAFMMIAQVGTAKSMYIEALQLSKKGNHSEANKMYLEANTVFSKAHEMHFELVQKEAQGEDLPFSLIFMHAEDQLLSTETIQVLVKEIMFLHENK